MARHAASGSSMRSSRRDAVKHFFPLFRLFSSMAPGPGARDVPEKSRREEGGIRSVGRVRGNARPRRTVNSDRSRQHDSGVRWMVYGSRFIHLAVVPGRSCPLAPPPPPPPPPRPSAVPRAGLFRSGFVASNDKSVLFDEPPSRCTLSLSLSLSLCVSPSSSILPTLARYFARACQVVRHPHRCEFSFSEGDRCVSYLDRKKTTETRSRPLACAKLTSVFPRWQRGANSMRFLRAALDERHVSAGLGSLQNATNRSLAMRGRSNSRRRKRDSSPRLLVNIGSTVNTVRRKRMILGVHEI